MTRGVVYFVEGQLYLRHALNSLRSLRRFHPDMPACLYSNSVSAPDFDLVRKYESVNAEYEHNEIFLDRVRCLATAPYDHSLFLDADTYVDAPLDGMFCLLDRFDLAARQSTHYTVELEDVPPSFYEYSAGVMLWKWNARTRALFGDWADEMVRCIEAYPGDLRGHRAHSDQVPLRRVLYHSDVRLASLPHAYLCRPMTGGLFRGRAVISHGYRGHPGQLAKRVAAINRGQPIGDMGTFRWYTRDGGVVPYSRGDSRPPIDGGEN